MIDSAYRSAVRNGDVGEVGRRIVAEMADEGESNNEQKKQMSAGGDDASVASHTLEAPYIAYHALSFACMSGQLDVARHVLSNEEMFGKVDVNKCVIYNNSPLCLAVKSGKMDLVQLIASREEVNINGSDNFTDETALHHACWEGDFDMVRYLVEDCHANANKISLQGTPFIYGCFNEDPDIIRYLLPRVKLRRREFQRVWRDDLPWDNIKELTLESYSYRKMNLPCGYSWLLPLHVVARCPLPSLEAFEDCFRHYGREALLSLDEDGRLPLHIVLTEASVEDDYLLRQVVLTMIKMEPNAAKVKDPTTGLFPFEASACYADPHSPSVTTTNRNEYGDDHDNEEYGCGIDDASSWFNVTHSLLRDYFPAELMRQRATDFVAKRS